MDAQQFAYWLQGFAELNEGPPSDTQWQSIREHLATVFVKVTPPLQPGIVKQGPLDRIISQPQVPHDPNRWIPPLRVDCTTAGDPLAGRAQTTC